jgi:hypothetical protein
MDLIDRFNGQRDPAAFWQLVANPNIERAISYQLLLMGNLEVDADALTHAIRSIHPSLAKAQAEVLELSRQDVPDTEARSIIGLAGWGNHVIKFVGFEEPVPKSVFDMCVRPSHISEELKEVAARHRSHLLIYYAGYEKTPLEQFVGLTVVATALAKLGAILLLNEAARNSFPAEALLAKEPGDALEALRTMPIPLLYGGFVKIEIEDQPGVWMRTFGNVRLNLPDLAFKTEGHHQGNETFDLFANMLGYLLESGTQFAPGHTVQLSEQEFLRLRAPTEEEWFLESDGEMLVVEKGGSPVDRP